MQNMKQDILEKTLATLADEFAALSLPPFRARQVYAWLHEKRAGSFSQMTDLPKALRELLDGRYSITGLPVEQRLCSRLDATQKFLLRLADGNCVETVLMEYRHGNTVCISTQVGCRMGCGFCASTLGGLVRSLTAGEMLAQVYAAERESGKKAGGVVLMGIGEPLDNFDAVVQFLTLLSSPQGKNLSLRHVSLSTCGLAPQIDALAALGLPLTLSVSLHAADDETRSALMPINRRYPIAQLMAACKRYFKATGRRISFEYALVCGKNDTPQHAQRLIALLRGMNCHVNLIPVNEVAERGCRRPRRRQVEQFQKSLSQGGLNATVRRELGSDIAAACGQLRRSHAKEGSQCSGQPV